MNRSCFRRCSFRWALLSLLVISFSVASHAQVVVGVSVRVGPPALPVYAQPICPGPGYMWTPGYWAWNDDGGYYWVPGTWVVAPVGLLWTPGYWGWGGGVYMWHAGYWGPHIGFYGGVNYGFGYGGDGFAGGEWRGGSFYYNRSVTNVSVTNVTNVYNKTVIVNENHTAFNGGEGGIKARPTAREEAYAKEKHTAPLASQTKQQHMASQNKQNFASANHGKPAVAATAKPGDFSSKSAVSARSAGGEYHAPKMSPKEARAPSNNAGNKTTTAANKGSNQPKNQPHNQAKMNSMANNQHNNNNANRSNETRNQSRPQPQYHPASQPQEHHSNPAPQQQTQHSSPQPQHHSNPPARHGR